MNSNKTDWVNYRQLKEGEIIEKDDEVYVDSSEGWHIGNPNLIGSSVPSLQPAHRIYRRRISVNKK